MRRTCCLSSKINMQETQMSTKKKNNVTSLSIILDLRLDLNRSLQIYLHLLEHDNVS